MIRVGYDGTWSASQHEIAGVPCTENEIPMFRECWAEWMRTTLYVLLSFVDRDALVAVQEGAEITPEFFIKTRGGWHGHELPFR